MRAPIHAARGALWEVRRRSGRSVLAAEVVLDLVRAAGQSSAGVLRGLKAESYWQSPTCWQMQSTCEWRVRLRASCLRRSCWLVLDDPVAPSDRMSLTSHSRHCRTPAWTTSASPTPHGRRVSVDVASFWRPRTATAAAATTGAPVQRDQWWEPGWDRQTNHARLQPTSHIISIASAFIHPSNKVPSTSFVPEVLGAAPLYLPIQYTQSLNFISAVS